MTLVAGVDGCRGGWVCVMRDVLQPFFASVSLFPTLAQLLSLPRLPHVIAIDIPIGLPARVEEGGRLCDRALRARLGQRRHSVFAIPAREAVMQTDYRKACAVAANLSDPPKQISKQTFYLFPKIRETDALAMTDLKGRIFECHPEGSFWAMNNQLPFSEPKKLKGRAHRPGLDQRRRLLLLNGFTEAFLNASPFRKSDVGEDDFIDACACAWSAERIHENIALRFPEELQFDKKGLPMQIVV